MGTALKHPVPDRLWPSFGIFDVRALLCSALSGRMLYSCTHVATVGVKGLKCGTVCVTVVCYHWIKPTVCARLCLTRSELSCR